MVQTVVNTKLAIGVVGEFYDNSPRRVHGYILAANGSVLPAISKAFTKSAEGIATVGGNGLFLGLAVNPKEQALHGGLTPSLVLKDGAQGSLCDMGHIVVKCTTAVTEGQACFYNTTDGTLAAAATGSVVAGHIEIKGSKFVFFNAAANEPAVVELLGFTTGSAAEESGSGSI